MSIYSGFVTRQQEQLYDQLTKQLIDLLLVKLQEAFKYMPNLMDSVFRNSIQKRVKKLKQLDQSKYLKPRLSLSFLRLQKEWSLQLEKQQTCSFKTKSVYSSKSKYVHSQVIALATPKSCLTYEKPQAKRYHSTRRPDSKHIPAPFYINSRYRDLVTIQQQLPKLNKLKLPKVLKTEESLPTQFWERKKNISEFKI